jgi:hypothetical protein
VNSESVLLLEIDLDEYNLDKPFARASIMEDIADEIKRAKLRGEK